MKTYDSYFQKRNIKRKSAAICIFSWTKYVNIDYVPSHAARWFYLIKFAQKYAYRRYIQSVIKLSRLCTLSFSFTQMAWSCCVHLGQQHLETEEIFWNTLISPCTSHMLTFIKYLIYWVQILHTWFFSLKLSIHSTTVATFLPHLDRNLPQNHSF